MNVIVRSMTAFWALYYALITLTNIADLAAWRYGWVWAQRFRSGNLLEIQRAVETVQWPETYSYFLLAAVVLAEAIACGLFTTFSIFQTQGSVPPVVVSAAFGWGALVWQSFLLADSVFRTYQFTVVHTVLLCATLLTALVYRMS